MTVGVAGMALMALAVVGCADDERRGPATLAGDWEVTMVVGARTFDASLDGRGLTQEGDAFIETWRLDCDDAGCTLTRPEGGAVLGELDAPIALAPVVDGGARLTGSGTSAVPVTEGGADPCAGTDALAWTVEVDVARVGDSLQGSVTRTSDALFAPNPDGLECIGVGLVLGLAGVPAD